MTTAMTFLDWWKALNIKLATRDEPEALHGEARVWWESRPSRLIDDRLVNRIINDRRPL